MLLPGQRENDLLKILIVTTCALELGALWWLMDTTDLPRSFEHEIIPSTTLTRQPRGVLPYITYTGMCCATGSWFWSSWFRTGYPFQRHFLGEIVLERGANLEFWAAHTHPKNTQVLPPGGGLITCLSDVRGIWEFSKSIEDFQT